MGDDVLGQSLLNPKSLLAIQQHHPEYHQDTEGQGRSRNHGPENVPGAEKKQIPQQLAKGEQRHNRQPKQRDAHQDRHAHQISVL